MDRNIVYPGSIPQDTDILSINRNAMIAIGFLAQAVFGTNAIADGLTCQPTSPASTHVVVGPGSLTQFGPLDQNAYGSLAANITSPIVKMGINVSPTPLDLSPPASLGSGQSINYLIQACFQEVDQGFTTLPYYNASNPTQSFNGPNNQGLAQATMRVQKVSIQAKAGVPGNTGSQTTPSSDVGWIGLYQVSVASGQTAITSIVTLPTAPFATRKLLPPGVQSFLSSSTFNVPAGISQVEVEVWGAGSGSFASSPSAPSGGGSGGGYARRLIGGLTPGQVIPVIIGSGGIAGTTAGASAGNGGTSSFGSFVSAGGGSINVLANTAAPGNGATPPGIGINGDVNLIGSAGQAGVGSQGGLGGAAPMGGTQNSGLTGNTGIFPGGGAAGAGTGSGNTGYNGGAGASGLVVVRW